MSPPRSPCALLAVALCLAAVAAADTGVLVLRDGLRSEYAFCREDEWGGWGKRHPCLPLFRGGLLDYAHRFEHYLAADPRLRVRTLDVETVRGDLPLGGIRLVILDDVRAAAIGRFAQPLLSFAEAGGSVVVVGGFHGFGGCQPNPRFSMTGRPSDYRTTPLARLLPVEVLASPDYTTTRTPKLAFAARSPLGAGLAPGAWPLHGYHRTRARPTAKVLATIDGQPLVAYHAVGRGLAVAFTGSELEVAYANWRADPWPDEASFWQRVAALALGALDLRLQLHAPAEPSLAATVEVTLTSLAAESRKVDLDAWIETPQGQRLATIVRHEPLRLPPGKPVAWTLKVDLAEAPPGARRTVVVRATDPRRDGALCTAAARLTAPPSDKGLPAATLHVADSVRRGRPLAGELTVEAKAPPAACRLSLLEGRRPLAAIDARPGTTRFALHTAALRPGPYTLQVATAEGRPLLAQRLHVAEYNPHFQNLLWWGQGDFPPGSHMRRRMVRDLLAHRTGAGAPPDVCERHGIWSMKTAGGIGALSRFAGADKKPEAQWTDATGKRRGKLCFNDPLFEASLARWAESLAPRLQRLHSLRIVHIEDEAGCPDCYCEDCLRLFRAQHGYEMPRPKKGFAPSPAFLDKWVARMDFKLATFARYHKRVRDELRKHLPDDVLVLTSLPQGFTVAHGETVLDHQRHLDAFWEHTYPGSEPLGAALTAHRVEMAAAALGAPDRPFIHLLQGFDEVSRVPKMPPREYMRLISWMALAHGADHLGWFVYRWMWWHMPGTEAWDAARDVAAQLERLAPTLEQLRPVHQPLALLYPLSQECADHLRSQTATDAELPQRAVWVWRVWHSTEDAYYALKFAGLPFEPLYEQSVMAGKLRYRAIVVPHADYLRKEVRDRLATFLDDGGHVYLGASSTLDLPGATKLPMDFLTLFNTYFPPGRKDEWGKERARCFWIRQVLEKAKTLRTLLAPLPDNPVALSQPQVVYNLRDGGDVKYLFLLNDTITQTVTPRQRDLRRGYAHFAILPMTYHRVRVGVSLRAPGPIIDVLARRRVATPDREGRATFEAELDGGGARLYALLPHRIRSLRLATRRAVAVGEPLAFHVGVWARHHLVVGVVPLEITLEAGGHTRRLYAATRAGECQGELPTDIELPTGGAVLTATELLTGRSVAQRLKLTPAEPLLTTTR